MTKKLTTSEQDLAKLDAFSVSEKDGCCEVRRAASGTSQPKEKIQSKEKLPRLKLEELVAQVKEKDGCCEVRRAASGTSQPKEKTQSKEKLPRLKLEELVAQVTEENAHKEISTGPSVGNEV